MRGLKHYTVHVPPGVESWDKAVFVRDGLSWGALLIPLPWLIWRRLWTALVWWIAFALVVAWAGRLLGDSAASVIAVLGQVFFALEANNYRRAALERRGWDEIGGSFGADREEAELRFFHRPVAQRPTTEAPRPEMRPTPAVTWARSGEAGVIGLFPEPGR